MTTPPDTKTAPETSAHEAAERGSGFAIPSAKPFGYGAAGPCPSGRPSCEQRPSTRIYKSAKETQFCICDNCGQSWQRKGTFNPLVAYCEQLIEALERAALVDDQEGRMLMLPEAAVRELTSTLREAIGAAHKAVAPVAVSTNDGMRKVL